MRNAAALDRIIVELERRQRVRPMEPLSAILAALAAGLAVCGLGLAVVVAWGSHLGAC